MRRVPSLRSDTRPASLSTLRCCDTAGRLTGRSWAISPTGFGPSRSRSNTVRRVGSVRAAKARCALVTTYRKQILTDNARADSAGLEAIDLEPHGEELREQFGGGVKLE